MKTWNWPAYIGCPWYMMHRLQLFIGLSQLSQQLPALVCLCKFPYLKPLTISSAFNEQLTRKCLPQDPARNRILEPGINKTYTSTFDAILKCFTTIKFVSLSLLLGTSKGPHLCRSNLSRRWAVSKHKNRTLYWVNRWPPRNGCCSAGHFSSAFFQSWHTGKLSLHKFKSSHHSSPCWANPERSVQQSSRNLGSGTSTKLLQRRPAEISMKNINPHCVVYHFLVKIILKFKSKWENLYLQLPVLKFQSICSLIDLDMTICSSCNLPT